MRMAYGVCLEFASIYSLNLNYSYVEKYDINIYIYICMYRGQNII